MPKEGRKREVVCHEYSHVTLKIEKYGLPETRLEIVCTQKVPGVRISPSPP